MRKISTENISETGLVLAADATGTSGNTLLSKGTVITPALGRRIRNWGVDFVFVEGEDDSDENMTAIARSPKEIISELQKMFEGTLDNPRMKKLFDAVCKYKLQKLTGGIGGEIINP